MIEKQTLWRAEAIALDATDENWFTVGGGQYGTGDLHVDATNIPDSSATGGVWHEINMHGFDRLRIYGEIICVVAGSVASVNLGLVPFAFARPDNHNDPAALVAAPDRILGVDLARASANNESGGTRLTNIAVQRTAETTDMLLTSRWDASAVSILPGALTTDAQPILRAGAGAAPNQVQRWWYDIAEFGAVPSSIYAEAINPGLPFSDLTGHTKVYVAMLAREDGASTGSGALIGGTITAVKYREGSSMR